MEDYTQLYGFSTPFLFLAIFIMFVLLSTIALADSAQTSIISIIPGVNNTCFLPVMHYQQNLIKNSETSLIVTVYEQSLTTPYAETLTNNVTVTINITSPPGTTSIYQLSNLDNGNYTINYLFGELGTYTFIVMVNDTTGITVMQSMAYVGKYPLSIAVLPGPELSPNESGEVSIEVTNSENEPVIGADAIIDIWYPNKSLWVNHSNMTEFMNGLYYYGFSAPQQVGEYMAYISIISNQSSAFSLGNFHVAPWAEKISDTLAFINSTFYGTIAVDPSIISGEITLDSTYTSQISVINLGTLPISITNVTTPSRVTPNFTTNTIAGSSDKQLLLSYDTSTLGNITGEVIIYSDARDGSTINITLNLTIISGGTHVSEGGTSFYGSGVSRDTAFFHYIDITKKEMVCAYTTAFITSHTQFVDDTEKAVVAYTPGDILTLRDTIAREQGIAVKYDDLKQYIDYPDKECPLFGTEGGSTGFWDSPWIWFALGIIATGLLAYTYFTFINNRDKAGGEYDD